MNLGRLALVAACLLATASTLTAQKAGAADQAKPSTAVPGHVLASAAYAETVLRQAELSSGIEAMLESYTEMHPSVVKSRLALSSIDSDLDRIRRVKADDADRLTAALGKLIVRKSELFADYRTLERQYDAANPGVRRAKKQYEIFAGLVDEVLPK